MAQPGCRRDHRTARRWTLPLAVVGLGLAQLGTAATGAGLATAAPAPTAPAAGAAASPGGGSGDSGGSGRSETPCAREVKACAKLSTRELWITDDDGDVLRGPIRMNHGDDDNPTPVGRFHVQRKDRHHVSQEQKGAKMPYSVFFDGEGRAFHEGDPARESNGCIRLAEKDAAYVFDHLDVGDSVQIVR